MRALGHMFRRSTMKASLTSISSTVERHRLGSDRVRDFSSETRHEPVPKLLGSHQLAASTSFPIGRCVPSVWRVTPCLKSVSRTAIGTTASSRKPAGARFRRSVSRRGHAQRGGVEIRLSAGLRGADAERSGAVASARVHTARLPVAADAERNVAGEWQCGASAQGPLGVSRIPGAARSRLRQTQSEPAH